MKTISELHFRVCDHGLFLPVARRLAREAGKVSYWSPSEKAFPTVLEQIGAGFPDLERVDCLLEDIETVDCFVFPDVGFGLFQEDIAERGIPVWGHLGADELELDRGLFLKVLEDSGLEVPDYVTVTGLSELKKHLADQRDKYVKVSGFRGDWETFHWRSKEEDENTLDEKAVRFGPFRERIKFYVFDPIPSEIEDGCDSYCIEGEFPSLVIHGMEAKDKAFIGAFQYLRDMPEEVRHVNEAFGPILARYRYRGFFSTEVRITDSGVSYFIDPTCRAGSPPSQVQSEMIGNYAEVIWEGANGNLVDPEPAAKFGVQALCQFHREREAWTYVKVNDELDRWVKSANAMCDGGVLCLPPLDPITGCEDWLVGIGDTMAEAIKHLQHNIKLLPDGCTCDDTQLCDLLRQVQEAEAQGMEFTDQPVPDPTIVIED